MHCLRLALNIARHRLLETKCIEILVLLVDGLYELGNFLISDNDIFILYSIANNMNMLTESRANNQDQQSKYGEACEM